MLRIHGRNQIQRLRVQNVAHPVAVGVRRFALLECEYGRDKVINGDAVRGVATQDTHAADFSKVETSVVIEEEHIVVGDVTARSPEAFEVLALAAGVNLDERKQFSQRTPLNNESVE
jgi:hypothetical protein